MKIKTKKIMTEKEYLHYVAVLLEDKEHNREDNGGDRNGSTL